jgi:DNA-binding FrmR family transcriptional regulator
VEAGTTERRAVIACAATARSRRTGSRGLTHIPHGGILMVPTGAAAPGAQEESMAKGRTSTAAPEHATCACTDDLPGRGAPGARRPRREHAVGVEPSLKQANRRQLRRIEGQVRGIARMIEEDRYCADIINQVSAVRESLQTVARNLMRNHLKHCATAAMRDEEAARDEMIEELLALVGKVAR